MMDGSRVLRLDGRVALVTGAARGLGAEIARALAGVGAKVLCTDVLQEKGEALAESIRDSGGDAAFLAHDVTDEAQWKHAVGLAVERFGGLDVLVNNAGIEKMALLKDFDLEDFRLLQEVNVVGVFLGIKHAVRAMSPDGIAGEGGTIVNISSVAGMIGIPALAGYCASKGAVRMMTKAAAVECAQLGTGIRVNSIHPAVVRTEMGDSFLHHFVELGLMPDDATSEASFRAAHPIGRFGEPRNVSDAVLYFASDMSRWTTGAELVVDGGYTAA
jgi:NAD(P)-dependent dehydrogenase (short-subunit alcohol dehydrogenase family)